MGSNSALKAALLLSGGADSLAIAWWKRPALAITIDYGQLAAQTEKAVSAHICKQIGIEHEIVTVDCRSVGAGDLAGHSTGEADGNSDWWPYRNQLLVTLAGMRALALGVDVLLVGTVRSDGARHRDGTPEFVQQINDLMAYQEGGLRVEAPAIALTTAQLIHETKVPPSLLAWAHSCHKANIACGDCLGCNKQEALYEELGSAYWNK